MGCRMSELGDWEMGADLSSLDRLEARSLSAVDRTELARKGEPIRYHVPKSLYLGSREY